MGRRVDGIEGGTMVWTLVLLFNVAHRYLTHDCLSCRIVRPLGHDVCKELLSRVDSLGTKHGAFVKIRARKKRNFDKVAGEDLDCSRRLDDVPIYVRSPRSTSGDRAVENIAQEIRWEATETGERVVAVGRAAVGSSCDVVVIWLPLFWCEIFSGPQRSTAFEDAAAEKAVIAATICDDLNSDSTCTGILAPDGDFRGIPSEGSNVLLNPM